MHAGVFRSPSANRLVVTLVNSWGWYRSHRDHDPTRVDFIDNAAEPEAIEGCHVDIDASLGGARYESFN